MVSTKDTACVYVFAVVEVDGDRRPVPGGLVATVEGKDQNETARFAFEVCHMAFHQRSQDKVFATIELDAEGNQLKRWMTAGASLLKGERGAITTEEAFLVGTAVG